jgi:hypothetical protein
MGGEVIGDELTQLRRISDAHVPGSPGFFQGGAQGRGLGALFGSEIAIAGTHGEAVGFANGFHPMKADGDIEITHHATNDGQLLEVFFAKNSGVGLNEVEELGYNRANTIKMPQRTLDSACSMIWMLRSGW